MFLLPRLGVTASMPRNIVIANSSESSEFVPLEQDTNSKERKATLWMETASHLELKRVGGRKRERSAGEKTSVNKPQRISG